MDYFNRIEDWKKYQNTLELLFLYSVNSINTEIKTNVIALSSQGLLLETAPSLSKQEIETVKEKMQQCIEKEMSIVNSGPFCSIDDFLKAFIGGCYENTKEIKLFDLIESDGKLLLCCPHYLAMNQLVEQKREKLTEMLLSANSFAKEVHCQDKTALNNIVDVKELIEKQEAIHEEKLASLANQIKESNKRVVLICGPSSSGKTSFAKRLCGKLEALNLKTLYMGTDDYYVEKHQMPKGEDGQNDYECIEALDVDLFQSNVKALIAGERVDAPVFDFEQMTKVYGQNYKQISKDTILVIEGILTLNEKLTSTIDAKDKFKIYISPISGVVHDSLNRLSNTDIRLMRRICRDYRARNTKVERTIELWEKVRNGEEKNIFPYIDEADVTFNTYCIYEPLVMMKYIVPLLMRVDVNSPYYLEAKRLRSVASGYNLLKEEDCIPNNSIIREFIGGSILVD